MAKRKKRDQLSRAARQSLRNKWQPYIEPEWVEARCFKCALLKQVRGNSWKVGKPRCSCGARLFLADASSVVTFLCEVPLKKYFDRSNPLKERSPAAPRKQPVPLLREPGTKAAAAADFNLPVHRIPTKPPITNEISARRPEVKLPPIKDRTPEQAWRKNPKDSAPRSAENGAS